MMKADQSTWPNYNSICTNHSMQTQTKERKEAYLDGGEEGGGGEEKGRPRMGREELDDSQYGQQGGRQGVRNVSLGQWSGFKTPPKHHP